MLERFKDRTGINTGGLALFVVLIAVSISIVIFVMTNGANPVGPSPVSPGGATPTPQPTATLVATATPNVIKPAPDRIGGNRWVVPGWEFIGFQTFTTTNDVMTLFPIRVQYPQQWTQVGFRVDTSAVNGVVRACLYGGENVPFSDDGGSPGLLVHDFGTVSATTTGTKIINGTWDVTTINGYGGFYWVAMVARGDTAVGVRTMDFNVAYNSPLTAQNANPSGSQANVAFATSATPSFIDTGCPMDGTGIISSIVAAENFATLWMRENG